MKMIYVQFLEAEKVTIISWFSAKQDAEYYPYFDAVTADDPRWHIYYESQGEVAKEFLPKPL